MAPNSEEQILAVLDRTSDRFEPRDVEGVLDLFCPDEDILLVGSEMGEVARGREGIRRSLIELFSRPEAYSFEWDTRDVSAAGDVAWVVAEGRVVVRQDDGAIERIPYRISGVLQRINDRWLWRMFTGSGPIAVQGNDQ